MSKEPEYEITNFANSLNKDCMNLMECIKKQDKDNKPILYLGKHFKKVILPYEEYQKMCNRLESIDNANPSEALECLKYIETKLAGLRCECERIKNHRCDDVFIQEHIFTTIKQALLKAQEQEKVLENYKKLNLSLVKQILENGVWVKGEYNNFYHLSPTDMNIVIKEDYFIIQELYFEDLDCVMDTTGFELCSSDYKNKFWLKEDKTE